MMARLKEEYKKNIHPQLMRKLGYKNPHCVPRLEKIVVNMGVGEAIRDSKILDEAQEHLSMIAGQKPLITNARKSVSAFKLRKGKPVGCKVTLRRDRMYEFFDRLVNFAIPRMRDFRGLNPNSFDRYGNYTFGIPEQLIFPEISYEKVKNILGMDITICVKCKRPEDSKQLLIDLGMPLRES